jgi:peptidoglycan/xylan/chitin deacetylase (PgdA/CDA1 family)
MKVMSADGIDFGAHTVSHPNLPALGTAAQRQEIRQCKLNLERHLDRPITSFSYPNSGSVYPEFDTTVMAEVRSAAFTSAVTSRSGYVEHSVNLFAIPRVGINRAWSDLYRFAWRLEVSRLMRTQ